MLQEMPLINLNQGWLSLGMPCWFVDVEEQIFRFNVVIKYLQAESVKNLFHFWKRTFLKDSQGALFNLYNWLTGWMFTSTLQFGAFTGKNMKQSGHFFFMGKKIEKTFYVFGISNTIMVQLHFSFSKNFSYQSRFSHCPKTHWSTLLMITRDSLYVTILSLSLSLLEHVNCLIINLCNDYAWDVGKYCGGGNAL